MGWHSRSGSNLTSRLLGDPAGETQHQWNVLVTAWGWFRMSRSTLGPKVVLAAPMTVMIGLWVTGSS